VTWHRVLASRVRALFVVRRLDRDLDRELRSHIEMETEANLRRGLSPQEARRAALREFGGVTQTAELYRESRGLPSLEILLQDLRYAWRSLLKAPGFTSVAIVSLALGIGANTAIFTVTDQVMLRSLPVRNPNELVRFEAPGPSIGMQRDNPHTLSFPMYKALSDRNNVFSGMIAHFGTYVNLIGRGEAERIYCDLVSGNYFQVLGIRPAIGRLLTPDDDQKPGAHPMVVLSNEFWQRRFGADPSIIGRGITLNQTLMTVVGVSEKGFRGLTVESNPDVMAPIMMKPQMMPQWPRILSPREAWLQVYARRKPGLARGPAEAAINVLYGNLLAEESQQIRNVSDDVRREFLARRLQAVPGEYGYSSLRQSFGRPLEILMALAGLVLLIACGNLAGLLSARAAARRTEFAIRLAVGAGRQRLIRQLMTESLLLSVAGCVAGLPLAWWMAGGLIALLPSMDASRAFHAAPDPRAILFTIAVSTIATVLFGLAPALQSTQPAVASGLRNETGASAGTAKVRFRRVLVAAQVALSLLLTITAGLFARTLHNVRNIDLGFSKENLVIFTIDPTLNKYPGARIRSLLDQAEQRIRAIPGVRGVAVAGGVTFNDGSDYGPVKIEGYNSQAGEEININIMAIGPGFFSALGVPLAAGREFAALDAPGSRPVVMITKSLARRYFGVNAIGRHIGWRDLPGQPSWEIVGVVSDITPLDYRASRRDFIFGPARQWEPFQLSFHVRTALRPESLFQPIRQAIREVDPAVPVMNMRTMEVQIDSALFAERMIALLSVCFGTLAMTLSAIGLYGIIAYSVARRTREMGIRMALGARKHTVVALVMKDVGFMLSTGMIAGVLCALAVGRLLRSQLFGVGPADLPTFVAAALLLAGIGFAAALIPARRAMTVDLVTALRYE